MSDALVDTVAESAKAIVSRNLERLWGVIAADLKLKKAEVFECFQEYLESTYRRTALVRTLYSKDTPIPISDVYVSARFSTPDLKNLDVEVIDENQLVSRFSNGHRIVVRGNGGSGKTVFLKHLWIRRLQEETHKVPILIELRKLNEITAPDLLVFCRTELRGKHVTDESTFESFCRLGRVEFIFDGYDEIIRHRREKIESQILEISRNFPNCNVLVSGREDDRFSSWDEFTTYSVAPLEIEEVRELISKVPFETTMKTKFLGHLDESFYSSYQSFLSNPLLAVMMLMTFQENAIIPSKLTTFYGSAFQTLLTWHDATKDAFVRDRTLSTDIFRRVFSTFCLITYYENQYEFDDASLEEYVRRACKYHNLDHKIEDVIHDFCESVNLLQRDGLSYVFVHRSFQEFFAAECTMTVVSGKAKEFLSEFVTRVRDNTFAMCLEIHPELAYDEFLETEIDDFDVAYSSYIDGSDQYHPILKSISESLEYRLTNDNGSLRLNSTILRSDPIYPKKTLLDAFAKFVVTDQTSLLLSVHNVLMKRLIEALDDASITSEDGVFIGVKFSVSETGIKFSVRNIGNIKLTSKKISRLRSKIGAKKHNLFLKLSKSTRDHLILFYDHFLELESNRQSRSKSISDILDI